jgi:outer membrane protein assembly factor BamD
MAALSELVRRFPQTDYARDARLKLDLTKDHLAGKEMAIGRWYLRRGEQLAAITRFRTVIERYQTTSHAPEALHRLVEAYLALGVVKEAQAAAAVLGHNYPGSEWYEDSYALMEEYGQQPRGKAFVQQAPAPTPVAQPAPEPAPATLAAPAVAPAPVPPPPAEEATPQPSAEEDAAKAEEKAEEEDGGWFDWF